MRFGYQVTVNTSIVSPEFPKQEERKSFPLHALSHVPDPNIRDPQQFRFPELININHRSM